MEQDSFDDRYGEGAYERLTTLLRRPCATFAEIAGQFGVSRECVRRWHSEFLPDAPAGRARRHACARYQQKRRLFEDPVFRAFMRHARQHLGAGHVELIPTRNGYRSRTVRLHDRAVALRDASSRRYRGDAAFVYIRLSDDDFALLPAVAVRGGAIRDSAFRNTFRALERQGRPEEEFSTPVRQETHTG